MARPGRHAVKPPYALPAFARELVASAPRRVALTFALLIAAGLTEGASLLVFVPALQLLQNTGDQNDTLARALATVGLEYQLGPVLLLCVMLIVSRALLVYAKNRCAARLHFGFADQLRLRIYRALGEAHWSHTGTLRSADLEDLLTSGIGRVQSGAWAIILLAQAVVLFTVYLTLSALASATLTALVGATGLAVLLALRGQRRRAAMLGARLNDDRQACFRELSTLVQGLKVAKSFGTENAHNERFAATMNATRTGYMRYADLTAQSGLWFQLASGTLLAGAVYVGARHLALDLPTLLVLVFCVARLAPYLGQVQGFAQELLFALPAWEQAHALEIQLTSAREAPPSGGERFTLSHALAMDGVSVHYPGASTAALKDVSLDLAAGSWTALVGPSGAGKSTLADILLGLITADSGTVRVDEQLLTPDLARAWRGCVGYVPQETFLLPDTVRANLLLGDPSADDSALWQALDAAAATEFVRALPHGLDSPVGERGTLLSGGERQRLALARALLRKPLLLVLDEATSALDTDNQNRIGRALASLRGRMTILLITHRSALAGLADQTVMLQAGRVSDVLTHDIPGIMAGDDRSPVMQRAAIAAVPNE